MKVAILVLFGLTACLATPTPFQQGGNYQWGNHQYERVADKDFLAKQKNILLLYKYVNQPNYYKQHYELAKTFELEQHVNAFTNAEAVHHFLDFYKHDILPRNQIFSVFYKEHLEQAIALFRVFYYAKDFETFYNTAVWARNYVNQGLFLYSFTVAVFHRPDTYGIVVPPIYEIYPYYFYNAEVINRAQYYKQVYAAGSPATTTSGSYSGYTINANYSGWYLNLEPEQSLAYFTEDVGINAFYYYYNLYHPYWLDTKEYPVNTYRGGEEYYYFHQQLLARYYLERLSNDFGQIESIDWQQPFESGYYPSLEYPSGLSFPQRPNWAEFHHDHYTHGQNVKSKYAFSHYYTQKYEERIFNAIDLGYVVTESGQHVNLFDENGFNTLGDIIEGNIHSPNRRFYGHLQVFARHLLSYSPQPLHKYHVAPSALQHFETSLRDPAFYHFYKNVILYFQKYKHYLPHYNYTNLVFDGVKVETIQVDPLVTFFDKFDTNIENAVWVNENEFEHSNFHVRARQHRLNHKPFTYKINVASDKAVPAVVRVFIGPKHDEYGRVIPLSENYINFVQFDQFVYNLQAGQNNIQRNSYDIHWRHDWPSYKEWFDKVDGALSGNGEFHVYGTEQQFTFPNRFLLPKGKQGGQTFQFYVIVSPYTATHYHQPHSGHKFVQHPIVGLGVQYFDNYPLGYPFDRPVRHQHEYHVPNAFFQDVVIYHKSVETINVVQN